jgi:arylsulfatase A-like enzyme
MQRIMSCVRERKTPNPPKYEALRNSTNGWTIHEAGTAQLDDIVGATMQKLKDMGADDYTIVVFTTDNGTEVFNWFAYQFWRFQFVQQQVAKLAQTAIEFPPMQKGASFNLEAAKAKIDKAIAAQPSN